MRSNLTIAGRLIEPQSRERAYGRLQLLQREIDKISVQLAERYIYERSEAWAIRAQARIKIFSSEERQLSAWLSGYKAGVKAAIEKYGDEDRHEDP